MIQGLQFILNLLSTVKNAVFWFLENVGPTIKFVSHAILMTGAAAISFLIFLYDLTGFFLRKIVWLVEKFSGADGGGGAVAQLLDPSLGSDQVFGGTGGVASDWMSLAYALVPLTEAGNALSAWLVLWLTASIIRAIIALIPGVG